MDMNFSFLAKVPDQIGFMVISNDSVIKSDGELMNRDTLAAGILKMLRVSKPLAQMASDTEGFEVVTINFPEFFYLAASSGKYIYVVKRRNSIHGKEKEQQASISSEKSPSTKENQIIIPPEKAYSSESAA